MAEAEWSMLVDALLQNTSLVEVDLASCKLTDEQIALLADALGKGALPALVELSFSKNNIGDQGMMAFVDALGKGALPALRELHLDLRDFATQAWFAEALGKGAMASLQDLIVDGPEHSALNAACESRDIELEITSVQLYY